MKYLSFLKGKTISIPYNNNPNLIKKLGGLLVGPRPFNVYIYFAPNPIIINAGRKLPNAKNYIDKNKRFNKNKFEKELVSALKDTRKYGFKTNLLLNNVLLGLPHSNEDLKIVIPKIQKYLEKLNSENILDRVTISNPYLLELINWKKLPNVEIKTSVNFQIKSSKSIDLLDNISAFWLNKKIDCIEIQKDLLRNTNILKKIKEKTGNKTKLSIIINEGCLTGCPYQMAHQLYAFSFPVVNGKIRQDKISFNIAKCKYITKKEPWRILDSNWILPSWLKYYSNLIDEFKLTDRDASTEDIFYIVKSYITGIYDKENLCKLISLLIMEKFKFPESALPKDFFEKITSGEEIKETYYKNIWKKIEAFNKATPYVGVSGFQKEDLHKFIGNN
jgi:collagenase-like PrtC family protease